MILKLQQKITYLFVLVSASFLFIFTLISCDKENPEPYLRLSESLIEFTLPDVLRDTIDISSNEPWEISNVPDWINVTPSSGNGDNSKIILEVDSNFTTSIREAIISITGNGATISRSISIKQNPRVLIVAGGKGLGSNLDQLNAPSAVFVDEDFSLFITDQLNHRVVKWLPKSSQGLIIAGGNGEGSSLSQLNNPYGIFVNSNGDMYICDNQNHRVLKWIPGMTSGSIVAGGNGSGFGLNQVSGPSSIYIVDNKIYLSEAGNDRVVKWIEGLTEGEVFSLGGSPSAVHLDVEGNVYIANNVDKSIIKWSLETSNTSVVAGGNGSGPNLNQFGDISGIQVDSNGDIFVTDQTNDRVVKWSVGATAGVVVAGGNGKGSNIDQLNSPSGLSLDTEGNIYISDQGNHRILKWLK